VPAVSGNEPHSRLTAWARSSIPRNEACIVTVPQRGASGGRPPPLPRAVVPGAPALPLPRVLGRIAPVAAVSAVLGGLASWYGYLEAAHGHPSLKLGGAMALAAGGTAALIVSRPAGQAHVHHDHEHSALVSVHPVRLTLAWLSMAAALIHFAVVQQHFEEYWVYGGFFIVVAIAQMGWAILAVVRPSRLLWVVGAAGNVLVIAAWVVTRTVGNLIGPAATKTEVAGFGDIVSTLFEAAIVLGALVLWRSRRFDRPPEPHRGELANALAALGVTLLTVLALYSAVGGKPFVSHVG
jgi:hypothetical protein